MLQRQHNLHAGAAKTLKLVARQKIEISGRTSCRNVQISSSHDMTRTCLHLMRRLHLLPRSRLGDYEWRQHYVYLVLRISIILMTGVN